MTRPIQFSGPVDRDELAEWTTAALGPEIAAAALPMSALPWPGRLVTPGGPSGTEQAVFVRTTRSDDAAEPAAEALYVHGLAGAAGNWTALAGLLSPLATGYAPDLPGSGRSDPPRKGDYSIREQVRVLAAVVREVAHGPCIWSAIRSVGSSARCSLPGTRNCSGR